MCLYNVGHVLNPQVRAEQPVPPVQPARGVDPGVRVPAAYLPTFPPPLHGPAAHEPWGARRPALLYPDIPHTHNALPAHQDRKFGPVPGQERQRDVTECRGHPQGLQTRLRQQDPTS